ncbi:hypothetical protein CAC42_6196 [Sphaceloma murrayae]|uniref:Cryptic loci regulator 2 N-terminal domain-containing protein n=1 Tax=Sphaceloma murrayae TaxID=2082308 RepID=A0A2K1QTN6_9PEZI|nr:hypothetical protein CAC42_6196 [Sphaceloma murrayae]
MGRFYPLYVRRSDGKLHVVSRHKLKEKNEPTPDQLDRKPDSNGISDYYREVDIDEQKHLDWRRKLGGMLARDLGQADSEKGYMLVTFPEHYRLYEHVKRAEDETKGIKLAKNHAGGGNERQDAYLYGHPLGRKKRFRSPADFYPHLLWLATDEAGDPDNCACKICCPEEVEEKSLPPIKKEVKQETKPIKQESAQRVPLQSVQRQSLQSEPQVPKKVTQTPKLEQPQTSASPLPNPRNDDQRLDLAYGAFNFRQGELVWYNRGTRWGLGVITRRWLDPTSGPNYEVQPLSHPYSHPQATNIQSETLLRPWLAWSVPNFTHNNLNNVAITFDTADWSGIFSKKYGEGDMEVDGSILAAKAIDLSYTPFDPISTGPSPSGTTTLYNGLYLGAERIWLGEPLRLRVPNLDVLVLHSIAETTQTSAFNNAVLSRSLTLTGDVYSMRQSSSSSSAPDLPSALPQRISEDLKRRNPSTLRSKSYISTYVLISQSATYTPKDIKGRWYEASLLIPIMNGVQSWESDLSRGEVGEMGPKMNSRLDCQRGTAGVTQVVEERKARRVEAFAGAAPAGVRVEEIWEGQGSHMAGQGNGQGGDGLDEFMNLDA